MADFDGSSPAPVVHRSSWHSPVPYIFGGLASMLGLIAFALLMLACSYWKLSRYFEHRGDGERDLEAGVGDEGDGSGKPAQTVMEEKYLVIMAGQVKPTFLATPASNSASSFGSKATSNSSSSSGECTEEHCAEKKTGDRSRPIEMENLDGRVSAVDQVR